MKKITKTLRQAQAVIFREGKVLILKKNDIKWEGNEFTILKKAYWRLPKGKVEKGETLLQGLKRELHEECGFTHINAPKKVYYYEYEAPKGTLRKVYAYALSVNQKPRLTKDSKAEGITQISLLTPAQALRKLHWPREKDSLKAALRKKSSL